MINELLAILEMQWCSKVNLMRRETWIGHLVTLVFSFAVAASVLIVFIIGLGGGFYLAKESSANYYLLAWNGITCFFVFAWIIYFSHDVFRSEGIPLQRLMHLPISPTQAFALNYFQSWLNLPMFYFFGASLGVILGGCIQVGPSLLWQTVPVLLYALMITSVTSLVQARIAAWLVNPRTRRFVLVLVPALVGLFSFGFAISTNTIRDRMPLPGLVSATNPETGSEQAMIKEESSAKISNSQRDRIVRTLQKLDISFPPMWLAGCLSKQISPNFTSLCLMRLMLCTSYLTLQSNYDLTLKYYRNGFDSDTVSGKLKHQKESQPVDFDEPSFIERRFPGLDETYSSIVAMSWLSLSRSPEIKLSMLLPMMQPIIMMILFGRRGGPENPHWQFIAVLALSALGLFLSSGFLCNLFGIDRSGFRFWVLSPIPRGIILHGRNLAFGLPALFLSLAMAIGIAIFWNTSGVVMLETVFGLLAFFPLYLLITNIMSILAPFPLPPGGMHPKEFSWRTLAMNLLLTCCLPIILIWCCVPVLLEALAQWFWKDLPSGPIALVGLVLVFWRSWSFYHQNLNAVGNLLQAREIDLLKTVTKHVEKK